MKSTLNRKSILILTVGLVLAGAPLFAQGSDGTIPASIIRVSTSTAASSSAGNALDKDYSSFWALEAGAAEGWAEIGFDKPYLVFGLDLSANLPPDAILAAEFFQSGEWHAFSGARFSGVNVSTKFYDMSFARAVTDRLRVRLSGSGAANARVYELAFRGRDRMNILTKVKPVDIEASENTSFLFPAENLCDGSVYTEWKTSISFHGFHPHYDDRPEAYKDHIRRRGWEERCLPPDRPDSSVVFELGREITLDSIMIYLSAPLHGDTVVSIGDGRNWRVVDTIPERSAPGWHRVDLHAAPPRAGKVKIAKEHGAGPLHEGIAEVEIWGYDAFDGDVFAETGIEAGGDLNAPVNATFYLEKPQDLRLELGLDRITGENLKVEVNGRVFESPAFFNVNGKGVACYAIPKKILWKGENFIRLRPFDSAQGGPAARPVKVETLRARLAAEALEEIALAGALGDGLLFQPAGLAGEQVFDFGRTALLKLIEAFGWDPGYVKLSAWINDKWREINFEETEPGVLVYPATLATDRIKIEAAGSGPGELRVLASPTLDSPPRVTVLWPQDGDEIDRHDLEHGKLVGFVDNPETQVTVNGKPAAKRGHCFWIDLEDVAAAEDGVYRVTAEAKDSSGRTGSATVEFTLEMPEEFRLDQDDEIIYTEEPVITISGRALESKYLVTVNGQPAEQSRSRFSKEVGLEIGFNLIRVCALDKRSGALIRTAYAKVVRTTGAIRVVIESPLAETVVGTSTIVVSGKVEGASGAVTATINGKKAEVRGTRFVSQPVPLVEGNNTVTVTVRDAAGKTATAQVTVTRDTLKPVLSDIQPPQDQLYTVSTVTVTGKVSDAGKVWVTAKGLQATVVSGGSTSLTTSAFSITLTLLDGRQVIAVEAYDAAGNRSAVYELRLVVDTTPPADFAVFPDPAGWTSNPRPVITFSTTDAVSGIDHYELKVDDGPWTVVTSPYTLPAQPDGEHLVVVKAVDKAGWTRISSTKVYIDTTAPGVPPYFRTVPGNGKIILKWVSPAEDVVSYQIYRDTDPDAPLAVLGGQEISFTDSNLVNATMYRYKIKAIDRADNESSYSEWQEGIVGLERAVVNPDDATIVEFDHLYLVLAKDSFDLPEGVAAKEVVVSECQSEQLNSLSYFGFVSPIYHFEVLAEKDGQQFYLDDVGFKRDYICSITYDPSRLPMAFLERNLGVYYFDRMWCRWFKVPKSAVDEEYHLIMFAGNHFSDFSVQPTMLEDLTPQELGDVGFSPLKTKSTHEGVTVSPQGGSAQVQVTELVLPGKNGFDFVLKRTYDSATARGDAVGLSLNASIKLNLSNILGSIFNIKNLVALGLQLPTQFINVIKRYLQDNGDYSYSMGVGWRLNIPYIRGSNSQVLLRTPDGAFHSIYNMRIIKAVDNFGDRDVTFENHENADFTLHITQRRLDFDIGGIGTDVATGQYAGIFKVPGWQLISAELTMKDGSTYYFDWLGRCTKMVDAQGLNEINFHYNGLVLDYIEDSMGRKIRFEYQPTYLTMPRITRIWVEGDPKKNDIEYSIHDALLEGTPISAPLLDQAKDVGGRAWHYNYDFHLLVAGGGGIKINFVMLILEIIPVTRPAAEAISASGGPAGLTLHANIQTEFVFLVNEVWGPGIGHTKITNNEQTLTYLKIEPADFILGFIPTAIDISFEVMKRVYTSRLELYEYYGGPHVKTTDFSYAISSAGAGQFYTSLTTENDGRQEKIYNFTYVSKMRCRWITWSDWAADNLNTGLLTSNPFFFEVNPYNTSIVTYNAATNIYHNAQSMSWDTSTMRLIRQRMEYSAANYQETDYTYDIWANPVHVMETRRTGDRILETETWSYYYDPTPLPGTIIIPWPNPPSTPAEIFNNWPNPYSAPSLTREIHSLLLAQAVKNNPPPEAGLPGPTYLVTYNNYNGLGQLAASSQWAGTAWAETAYTYNTVHGSPESVTKPNGHVTRIDYDYDFAAHPGFYYITTTEKDVKDADGNAADIITAKAFDFAYGNLVWDKNPRGYVTQTEHDGLGRVTKITEPDDDPGETAWDPRVTPERPNGANNPVTSVQYNDTDLWSKVTNAKGKTTFYDYDQVGRLVRIEKENAGNAAYSIVQIKNDAWNNIIEITDPNGNTSNYAYDLTGRMTSVAYPPENGARPQKTMAFNYNANELTTLDENRHLTIYILDFKGRLLQRRQFCGLETIETSIYYDSLGNQILSVDPMGNRSTNIFDCRNLLERTILPQATFFENGASATARPYIRYEYDLAGVKTKDIADTPNGEHEVVYETDGLSRVIRAKTSYTDPVSGPVQTASETFYDAKGNQVRVIDAKNTARKRRGEPYYCAETVYSAKDKPLVQAVNVKRAANGPLLEPGNITRMTYDVLGNVLSMTDPRGTSGKYAGNFTLLYHYDELNRLVKGKLPAGIGETQKRIIEFIYDPRGNLLERYEPDGAKTRYMYTPRNKVATETVIDKDNAKSYTTTHKYDPVGNETSVIDNLGNETKKIYDEINRLKEVRHPEGNSETYKYDLNSNLIKTTDGNNHSTQNEYDAYKRVTATIDAKNKRFELFYDRLGNKTKDLDPNSNVNLYQYDELNRLVKETTSLGFAYTYRYDEVKNIIESVDANGTKGVYIYTPDYLVDTIVYTNGAKSSTVHYEYDEAGAVKSASVDGVLNGSTTLTTKEYNKLSGAYTPDPYGRILAIDTTYSGKTTRIGYECDNRDRITAVVYPNGRRVNYEYNTLSELLRVPGYIEEAPEYNGAGLISRLKAINGTQTEYQYDKNLRLTLLSHTDKNGEEIRSYALKYDDANNIIEKNQSSYSYDELNRLVYADLRGRFKAGNPDADQRADLAEADYVGESALSINLDPGRELKLDHNARSVGVDRGKKYVVSRIELHPSNPENRLHTRSVKVYLSDLNSAKAYRPVADMSFVTRPDGVIELRLKEAQPGRYVKVHCYFDDRDEENNPIPDAYATAGNTALKLMKVFYMAESRQEVYGYDAIGNRTTQSISSDGNTTTTSYVYYKNTAGGDSQRLQSDGTYTYEYDNNGNLLRKTEIATGNIWEYEFNLLNRLVAVYRRKTTDGAESHSEASSGRTRIATYVYDEAGYRVRKQSTEKGMTDYVFSAHGVVLFEEKSAGDYREYVYVFNDLFAKVEGKAAGDGSERKKYFYHTDHLGSTTAITDETGNVVWKNDFTPFGTETGYEGAEEHDAKFTGKDYDEEIALYYFNARWYDPELGRFISQDPIKDGVNYYVYCSNRPLSAIDPTGLFDEEDPPAARTRWSEEYDKWSGPLQSMGESERREGLRRIRAVVFMQQQDEWYVVQYGLLHDAGLDPAQAAEFIEVAKGNLVKYGTIEKMFSDPKWKGLDWTLGFTQKAYSYGLMGINALLDEARAADRQLAELKAVQDMMGFSWGQQQQQKNNSYSGPYSSVPDSDLNPDQWAAASNKKYYQDKALASDKNQAVFWSGIPGGSSTAANWAAKNKGTTLEMTLDKKGIKLPKWNPNDPAAKAAWVQASKDFAAGAKGNVRVLQREAVRVDSIWSTEFKTLVNNPNVTSITAINPVTGAEVKIWQR